MDAVHLWCKGNLETQIGNKKVKLAAIRKVMKDCNLDRKERKLARSLATPIFEVCKKLSLPGNLYNTIITNQEVGVLSEEDKIWLSDFQNGNPDCPERLQNLIRNHFNSKTNPNKKNKINKK